MPTVELDIRQLADEGGTAPLAPITVTDAVLDEDGNTLTDTLDEIKAGLNNSGSEYIKLPDGTAIAWGRVTFPSATVGRQEVSINFPIEFTSKPMVVCTWDDTANVVDYMEEPVCVHEKTTGTTLFIVAKRLQQNYAWYTGYIAIGKWK